MKVIIPKENATIKIPGEGTSFEFKKNSVYVMSDVIAHQFQMMYQMKNIKFDKYNKILDINEYYKKLNYENDKNEAKKIIIIRTGGIGDLIALSSITKFIYENLTKNITQISSPKYTEVFKQYSVPVDGKTFFEPVENKVDFIKLKKGNRLTKTIFFEGVIENSKENQYEVQFNTINALKYFDSKEFGRPHLKIPEEYKNVESKNIDKSKKSILVNPKSTSRIRTMPFSDIYNAILEVIKDNPNYNIYVHEYNLASNLDRQNLKNIQDKDSRVKVIKAENLREFFIDAKDATYTISVDTALIHFREGIKAPGLGIYAAFPVDARTKYYQYTKSIDIPFDKCKNIPCFIHTKRPFEHCSYAYDLRVKNFINEDEYAYAPCIYSKTNENLINKISEAFKLILN